MTQKKLTVIELFSGIGAQRKALERIGIEHEVVCVSDIDKYAHKSYEAIFGKTDNFGDITKIEKLPYADLWTYSFPCTDLSVAGKCLGLNNTRSGLLYEVERLLNISKESNELPKYLLLENVKNLVGKKFKSDFDKWLEYIDSLGYNNYWQVLNAKDYGIPQNRERVFVVSIRKDIDTQTYKFPEKKGLKLRIKDIKEYDVDKKYYLSEEIQNKFKQKYLKDNCDIMCVGNVSTGDSQCGKVYDENGIFPTICACTHGSAIGNLLQVGEIDIKGNEQIRRVYSEDGRSPSLITMQGGNRQPKILEESINNKMYQLPHGTNKGGIVAKDGVSPTITTANWQYNNLLLEEPTIGASRGRNPENSSYRTIGAPTEQRLKLNKNGTSNTITAVQKDNYLTERDFTIRKLTPKECWRLMGFDDKDFYKAKNDGLSDTQLYKQAGNSIVVNVLECIFKNLFGEN